MSQPRIGRSGLDYAEPILFERTSPGRVCSSIPPDSNADAIDQAKLESLFGEDAQPADESFNIPEISELELSRHYTRLSRWNHAIDLGAYPLGSCTMKYNPKINEWAARLEWSHEPPPLFARAPPSGRPLHYVGFTKLA